MFYEKVKKHIDGVWMVLHALLDGPWKILNDGMLIRRASLGMSWYVTIEAYHFCYKAAEMSGWSPAAIGACIGILTPVSAMQGAVLKFYSDDKRNEKKV